MAFVIVTIREIKDQSAFDEYASKVKPMIESFGGKYVVVERDAITKSGDWPYVRTVLVEFPSLARAKEWYTSRQYQALIPVRERAMDINFVMVRGLEETKQEKSAGQ